jgi:lysozyme family protein
MKSDLVSCRTTGWMVEHWAHMTEAVESQLWRLGGYSGFGRNTLSTPRLFWARTWPYYKRGAT